MKSRPKTPQVHIDNGVLALTLALSPQDDYVGGGTFFEHLGEDALVEMDAGHATWRPGSVRHGGHRVSKGERYIIGAFLLLEDRVEHVRRLKNRGAKLRGAGDLAGAAKLFEWALAINPKCATCLKDWSEAREPRGEPRVGSASRQGRTRPPGRVGPPRRGRSDRRVSARPEDGTSGTTPGTKKAP